MKLVLIENYAEVFSEIFEKYENNAFTGGGSGSETDDCKFLLFLINFARYLLNFNYLELNDSVIWCLSYLESERRKWEIYQISSHGK